MKLIFIHDIITYVFCLVSPAPMYSPSCLALSRNNRRQSSSDATSREKLRDRENALSTYKLDNSDNNSINAFQAFHFCLSLIEQKIGNVRNKY